MNEPTIKTSKQIILDVEGTRIDLSKDHPLQKKLNEKWLLVSDEIDFLQDIYQYIDDFGVCKQIEQRLEQLKGERE